MLNEEEEPFTRITTSSSDLDNILGGGISCREVTEIGETNGLPTLCSCVVMLATCLGGNVDQNTSFNLLGGVPGIGKTQMGYEFWL